MILRIELEKIFPDSEGDSRRNRMHLMKLMASHNAIVANMQASCALGSTSASEEAKFVAYADQSYFYRVICSHLYEIHGDFKRCRESGMIERFGELIEEGPIVYERLVEAMNDNDLLRYLREVRLSTFHGGMGGELESEGFMVIGVNGKVQTTRYTISEQLTMARIHRKLGLQAGSERLDGLQKKVANFRDNIVRFVDRFVSTIYVRCKDAFSLHALSAT